MNRNTLFVLAAAVLVLVFAVATLMYTAEPKPPEDGQMAGMPAAVAELDRSALVRMHSPSLGEQNAPVVIVEFLDPACETCAIFYPRVKALMDAHPGKIRIVLRYAPFHRGSDQVVAALEAARKQGQYWPALETLLANQANWTRNHVADVELALPYLEGLGLDMERLRQDMNAPEIAALIAQDLADANTLNVNKTPDYFVNGQPLPSFGFQQLQDLVDAALSQARGG